MDDALNERMAALDKDIEQGREWPALRAIKEEIINLHGLSRENVDELERRVKELEERCEILRSNCNKLFAETRDLITDHKARTAAQEKG